MNATSSDQQQQVQKKITEAQQARDAAVNECEKLKQSIAGYKDSSK